MMAFQPEMNMQSSMEAQVQHAVFSTTPKCTFALGKLLSTLIRHFKLLLQSKALETEV